MQLKWTCTHVVGEHFAVCLMPNEHIMRYLLPFNVPFVRSTEMHASSCPKAHFLLSLSIQLGLK